MISYLQNPITCVQNIAGGAKNSDFFFLPHILCHMEAVSLVYMCEGVDDFDEDPIHSPIPNDAVMYMPRLCP